MTAVLVTASAAKVFMRVTSTADDSLIQTIVDSVEELFLVDAGRKARPVATTATAARTEYQAGTGTCLLTTDYPIASITSLKIGHDASDPDETLTATDVDVVTWATGSRSVYRTDGGWFGLRGQPRMVQIVYTNDADANTSGPTLAIKRAVAQVYRQIGSEDAKSETLPDGYTRTLADIVSTDPIWQMAVKTTYEPEMR